MILRQLQSEIEKALRRQAAVAIVGPRQVGKTTLALQVGEQFDSIYLDLENPEHRDRLDHPRLFFESTAQQLLILDEIHRVPELFQTLRGVIDRGRRDGLGVGRFLMLGSASVDLLRQSGETLAGRITYLELTPLRLSELNNVGAAGSLWLRGGFPASFLAGSDSDSMSWRQDFIHSYLEREVAIFGGRLPTETLSRLWIMLAHRQGSVLNASELGRSLGVSAQSITRYIDLLIDLLLIRRLPPFHTNVSKRLIKSPKLYVRDSGLLHALLGIESMLNLSGHPVIGMSWEGFVMEHLITAMPPGSHSFFYRTSGGAEIDLLIELTDQQRWAIEIKRTASNVKRGFHEACTDIRPNRRILVHGGEGCFPMRGDIEAMSLEAAVTTVANYKPVLV